MPKIIQKINIGQASGPWGPSANLASIQVIGQINCGPVPAVGMILDATELPDRLNQLILKAVYAALEKHNGNVKDAAAYLGISPSTIWRLQRIGYTRLSGRRLKGWKDKAKQVTDGVTE